MSRRGGRSKEGANRGKEIARKGTGETDKRGGRIRRKTTNGRRGNRGNRKRKEKDTGANGREYRGTGRKEG